MEEMLQIYRQFLEIQADQDSLLYMMQQLEQHHDEYAEAEGNDLEMIIHFIYFSLKNLQISMKDVLKQMDNHIAKGAVEDSVITKLEKA